MIMASNDRGSIVAAQQMIMAAQHRHRRAVAETLFMDARNIEALAPCTPLQQGMIARFLDSENAVYFNTFLFGLKRDGCEKSSIHKIRDAWESTFSLTQILRTVFVGTEEGFVQAVLLISPLTTLVFRIPDIPCQTRLCRGVRLCNSGISLNARWTLLPSNDLFDFLR